jgi:hypothetical protein
MAEHEKILNMTGALHRAVAGGDARRVRVALDELVGHLHPHTDAEEAGLFAVLRRNPDFTAHVDGLCAEHSSLDALAERIRSGEHDLVDRFVSELRGTSTKRRKGCSRLPRSSWTDPTGSWSTG